MNLFHSAFGLLATTRLFLYKLYVLARPYGVRMPMTVLVVVLLQGVLQVAGVTSIFPFLAIASDPDGFRASAIGRALAPLVEGQTDASLLFWAGLFSIAVLTLSNAVNFGSEFLRTYYGHQMGHWLRRRLLTRMASQPWSYFLQHNSGVLLKKATQDVMTMVYRVVIPLLEAISRIVSIVLLVVILLLVDWIIALGASLVLLIYYAVIFRSLSSRRATISDIWKMADRGAMTEAHQLFGGIKQIKVHRAEECFIQRYCGHSLQQARLHAQLPLYFSTPKYILEPIAFGGVIAIVIIYSQMGQNLGQVLPVVGVIGLAGYRLLPAAQLLYAQFSTISAYRHTLDEVYEEFRATIKEERAGENIPDFSQPPAIRWNQSIRLEKVSFCYQDALRPVIRDLDIEIPKNTALGIIGKTGAGKSTLVDLLMGLHQPSSGKILVDESPLTPEKLRAWQGGIGYVPQDLFLIDDTIARNIAFGIPDDQIDWNRLVEVTHAAQIHDFIESQLPDGFDTLVGERGVRLSGGQRQRIALARALYPRPELLILDEATSALDQATENEVLRAIHHLHGAITMVVIAHRMTTVEPCDRIIEIKEGKGWLRKH